MTYYNEKRDFIRMRVETPMTFELNGKSYDALCVDLSSTGMQIETDTAVEFESGQKIRVSIPSSHTKLRGLEADTQVQRIELLDNGRVSLGLEIIDMQ